MKFLSDIDTDAGNGHPIVEWEEEDGHRWWQEFNSHEEMRIALDKNQEYLNAHEAEVEEHFKLQDYWLQENEILFGEPEALLDLT